MIWCIWCLTMFSNLFFKWYIYLFWLVMNHVWFLFEILNKWIWEYVVGIKNSGWIINFFFGNSNKELCLFSFSLNASTFLSLIHQWTFPSLDHHVINGQHTLRLSAFPEAWNHPILGLLVLPFFYSVLNESPLLFLIFMV